MPLPYTHSLPEEAPNPGAALRGTSSPTMNIRTATHSLYSRAITTSSTTVFASVECNKGIGRALFGSTTGCGVRVLVLAAQRAACCILFYACLPSRGLLEHTSYIPQHREEHQM